MSKQELEYIRNIRIVTILGLKDDGRRKMIRCPFHKERTPSFAIFPDNGYKCFSCGKYGNGAIDFVMDLGFSFQQAVDELKTYLPK